MYLVGILPLLLYLSTLFNFLLIWYTYHFINENKNVEEDINLLFDNTEEFVGHLEQIYELEMYYGDQNLQNLIEHSKELINNYIDIQEKYYDIEVEINDEDDEEDTEDTENTEEEEEQLFYKSS